MSIALNRLNLQNLTHHFLIATPQMPDLRFERSLVYICRHDERGTLGLVINQPLLEESLAGVLEDLDIEVNHPALIKKTAFFGGFMHPEVGFVLHTGAPKWASSLAISENVCLTTSRDVLQEIANGKGVTHYQFCLGHVSWKGDQLLGEIDQGDWLLCPADLQILFNLPWHERWQMAGKKLGIDFDRLTDEIGHA